MRVTQVKHYQAGVTGEVADFQDRTASLESEDGHYYMAVADGHGQSGAAIAFESTRVIYKAADSAYAVGDGVETRVDRMRGLIADVNSWIARNELNGGSSLTAAVLKGAEIGVAYIGDTQAVYFPDKQSGMLLGIPHRLFNPEEYARMCVMNREVPNELKPPYVLVGDKKYRSLRAIGDLHDPVLEHAADMGVWDLPSDVAGTLVLGTNGLWGENMETYGVVEDAARRNAITDSYVAQLAHYNNDDASVVIARIEPS